MPNNTRIPFCPFYKDEKNKSISCEDTYHVFSDVDEKYAWMDMYCDEWDWQKCPYAMDLTEAYARLEKGDEKALEKQKIESMQKELKSLSSKLGRAEKRIERQQKKIYELRAVNQSYTNVNNSLEKQKKEFYKRWRAAQDALDKGNETVLAELQKLGEIYEQRMCYLIDTFTEKGYFYEADAEAWAGDKAFALASERIDTNDLDKRRTGLIWKVVFKEDEPDKDIQADVQEGQEVRQSESAD